MALSKSSINEQTALIKKLESQKVYLIRKRWMDTFLASFGLVFLSPLFFIVTILIKIEDRRAKVIFKQARVGQDGQIFYMYKFRSMVSNAEQLLEDLLIKNDTTGAMFKMKEDPRVTKVGKFIRKTSIDELPQLINVLKGEMTLVGPRPPLPREVEKYNEHHRQRLIVKPGCTGLWQVSGRSNIGFEEMIKLDLEYIEKRNIIYDVKIIFKTIWVLFGSKDAY